MCLIKLCQRFSLHKANVAGIHYEASKNFFFVSGKQTNHRSQSQVKIKKSEDIRKVAVSTTRKGNQQYLEERKRETPQVS